jgi:hypothetical protein
METNKQRIKESFALAKENIGKLILINLIPGILFILVFIGALFFTSITGINIEEFNKNMGYTHPVYYLFLAASLVWNVLVMIFILATLHFVNLKNRGEDIDVKSSLKYGLKNIFRFVLLFIVSYAVIFPFFFLLIIPGVIFSLFLPLVYIAWIQGKKPISSVVYTYGLVKGRILKVLGKILYPILYIIPLALIVLIIVPIILVIFSKIKWLAIVPPILFILLGIIILIFIIVLYFTTQFYTFRLFKELEDTNAPVEEDVVQKRDKKFRRLMIAGIILYIIYRITFEYYMPKIDAYIENKKIESQGVIIKDGVALQDLYSGEENILDGTSWGKDFEILIPANLILTLNTETDGYYCIFSESNFLKFQNGEDVDCDYNILSLNSKINLDIGKYVFVVSPIEGKDMKLNVKMQVEWEVKK